MNLGLLLDVPGSHLLTGSLTLLWAVGMSIPMTFGFRTLKQLPCRSVAAVSGQISQADCHSIHFSSRGMCVGHTATSTLASSGK